MGKIVFNFFDDVETALCYYFIFKELGIEKGSKIKYVSNYLFIK